MKKFLSCLCYLCVTANLFADFSISRIVAIPKHDVGPTYNDINNQGFVVGNELDGPALLWHESTGFVTMPSRGIASSGYQINNNNQICGNYATYNFGVRSAFLGTSTAFRDLGSNFGTGQSRAYGINDSGQVVGSFYASNEGYWDSHSFLWNEGNITLIENGSANVWAHSINKNGQVVGLTQQPGQSAHLFLWDHAHGFSEFYFPVHHGVFARINDAGQIIYRGLIIEDGIIIANLESQLGSNTTNKDINNKGVVVGATQGRNNELWPAVHAILWTFETGVIDLNTLLAPDSEWSSLTSAKAINDNNQILGTGILKNGDTAYFVANIIPEPATVSLLVLGAIIVRRKKANF